VYLTGGGARMEAIADLAGNVLGCPAVVARDQSDSGLQDVLDRPEYHTAIGLVKYGARQPGLRKTSGFFRTILGKARRKLAGH